MRNIGLVAFGITAGILVPAVALTLDAGPKQREMLFAPGADSLELDGTKIYATLDHRLVDPGGTTNLSLRTEGRVSVGIVVLGSTGNEGDRVPSPPVAIAHQTVTVDAHTTKIVPLELAGARDNYTGFASYSIYVMSPAAANRLAALQRRAGQPYIVGNDEIPRQSRGAQDLFGVIEEIGHDDLDQRDGAMFGRGKVALFHAYGRPVNSAITIEAPETAAIDMPIPIDVKLTNPSNKESVTLTVALEFPRLDDTYLGVGDFAFKGETSESITLAAGETRHVQLHVTSAEPGVVGVQAVVGCEEGDSCYRSFRTGAFEAIQVTSEQPVQTAAK